MTTARKLGASTQENCAGTEDMKQDKKETERKREKRKEKKKTQVSRY